MSDQWLNINLPPDTKIDAQQDDRSDKESKWLGVSVPPTTQAAPARSNQQEWLGVDSKPTPTPTPQLPSNTRPVVRVGAGAPPPNPDRSAQVRDKLSRPPVGMEADPINLAENILGPREPGVPVTEAEMRTAIAVAQRAAARARAMGRPILATDLPALSTQYNKQIEEGYEQVGQIESESYSGAQQALMGAGREAAEWTPGVGRRIVGQGSQAVLRAVAGKANRHGIETLPLLGDVPEATAQIEDVQRKLEYNPKIAKAGQAETWGGAIDALFEDGVASGIGAIFEVAGTSAVSSAPGLAGGAPGMFINSWVLESGNEFLDVLERDFDVDITDPEAVKAAINDEKVREAAAEIAAKKGLPVAVFDAASSALAGRVFKPSAAGVGSTANRLARMTGELGFQAALGGAGEAAGQKLAYGEVNQPGQVVMEMVGELGTGPVEIYQNIKDQGQRQRIEDFAKMLGFENAQQLAEAEDADRAEIAKAIGGVEPLVQSLRDRGIEDVNEMVPLVQQVYPSATKDDVLNGTTPKADAKAQEKALEKAGRAEDTQRDTSEVSPEQSASRDEYQQALKDQGVETEVAVYEPVRASGTDRSLRTIRGVLKELGINATFVRSTDGSQLPLPGFTSPTRKGEVVIDVSSPDAVAGMLAAHEANHAIKQLDPELWSEFRSGVEAAAPGLIGKGGDDYVDALRSLGHGDLADKIATDPEAWAEEGLSVVLEEVGSDGRFWTALRDQMLERPGVFTRIKDTVLNAIDSVLRRLGVSDDGPVDKRYANRLKLVRQTLATIEANPGKIEQRIDATAGQRRVGETIADLEQRARDAEAFDARQQAQQQDQDTPPTEPETPAAQEVVPPTTPPAEPEGEAGGDSAPITQETPDAQEAAPEQAAPETQAVPKRGDAFEGEPVKRLEGRESAIETGDRSIGARYAMVEADSLIPSHRPTSGFPIDPRGDVNERPYHDARQGAASRRTVEKIAASPDPRLLVADSPTPVDGPPMIAASGQVLGGNARTMGIQLAYTRGGTPAETIRRGTVAAAERFGIDPKRAAQMRQPVLVRVVDNPGVKGELSRVLNESMTTAKTEAVDAASRASKISETTGRAVASMLEPDESGESPSIREVLANDRKAAALVRRFVADGVVTQGDVDRMLDPKTGRLTPTAKVMIEDTLMARLIDDPSIAGELPASAKNKLIGALGPLVRAASAEHTDLRPVIQKAAAALPEYKSSDVTLEDHFFLQASMTPPPGFGDPAVAAMVHALDKLGPRQFRQAVNSYLDRVGAADPDAPRFGFAVDPVAENATRAAVESFAPDMKVTESMFAANRSVKAMFATLRAYHGGPADILNSMEGRFSLRYIGTGEGAQAYGWGLYFADKEEVAQFYKDQAARATEGYWQVDGEYVSMMSSPGWKHRIMGTLAKVDGLGGRNEVQPSPEQIESVRQSIQKDIDRAEKAIEEGGGEWGVSVEKAMLQSAQKGLEFLDKIEGKTIEVIQPSWQDGYGYEVVLAPEPDEYLLWDRPLSEQSDTVQQSLRQLKKDYPGVRLPGTTGVAGMIVGGDRIYSDLAYEIASSAPRAEVNAAGGMTAYGQQEASKYLLSLGIRGNKYLDQSSRGILPYSGDSAYLAAAEDMNGNGIEADEALDRLRQAYPDADGYTLRHARDEAYGIDRGSYNYVIFDEADIEIAGTFAAARKVVTPAVEINGQRYTSEQGHLYATLEAYKDQEGVADAQVFDQGFDDFLADLMFDPNVNAKEGFVTSDGEFVDRDEAMQIASEAGQVSADAEMDGGPLATEDLVSFAVDRAPRPIPERVPIRSEEDAWARWNQMVEAQGEQFDGYRKSVKRSALNATPDQLRGLTIQYNAAAKTLPKFFDAIKRLSDEFGGSVMMGPIKAPHRIIEKANDSYDGNIGDVIDVVRATLVVSSNDQALALADIIRDRFKIAVKPDGSIRFKDRFTNPEPSGYRDILTNIDLDGVVAEVQVNIPEMIEVKEHGTINGQPVPGLSGRSGHALYEIARDKSRPQEEREAAEVEQIELYSAALRAASARNSDSVEAAGAEPGPGSYVDGVSARPSSESTNTPSSGMNTRNVSKSRTENLEPSGNVDGMGRESGISTGIVPDNQSSGKGFAARRDMMGQQSMFGQGDLGSLTGVQRGLFDEGSAVAVSESVPEPDPVADLADLPVDGLQRERAKAQDRLDEIMDDAHGQGIASRRHPDYPEARQRYNDIEKELVYRQLADRGFTRGSIERYGISGVTQYAIETYEGVTPSDMQASEAHSPYDGGAMRLAFAHGFRSRVNGKKKTPPLSDKPYARAWRDGYEAAAHVSKTTLEDRAQMDERQRALDSDTETGSLFAAARSPDSPAFKRWFGDSVVTVDGRPGSEPLVVYHGTNESFSVFDSDRAGENSSGGEDGFFFYDDDTPAAAYGGVGSYYLSLSNPLVVDWGRETGLTEYDELAMQSLVGGARLAGHDGVVIHGMEDAGSEATQYVAFSPTQIKSATANVGTYDPSNADIRFAAVRRINQRPADATSAEMDFPAWLRRLRKRSIELAFSDKAKIDEAEARELYNEGLGWKQAAKLVAMDRLDKMPLGDPLFAVRRFPYRADQGELFIDGFNIPTETYVEQQIRRWQDTLRPIRQLRKHILDQGGIVNDSSDPYLLEEARRGKTKNRLEKAYESFIEPISRLAGKGDLSMEQIDDYLYARHAPERNRVIRERNPEFAPGGEYEGQPGSGMATDEANAIVEAAESGRGWQIVDGRVEIIGKPDATKAAAYKKIAERFDAMTAEVRNIWRSEGLETDEWVDLIESKYQFYAPLRTDLDAMESEQRSRGEVGTVDGDRAWTDRALDATKAALGRVFQPSKRQRGGGTGRAFNIRGKESKSALGRLSRADTPLAFAFSQLESAITRAEKNRVGQALLKMLRENPDNNLWRINASSAKPTLGKDGMVRLQADPFYKRAENVLVVKEAGQEVTIEFAPSHQHIADAMKGLGAHSLGLVTRTVGKITRTLAGLHTRWNPVFPPVNFIRDVGTASIHLAGEKGAAFAKDAVRDVLKAARAIHQTKIGVEEKSAEAREWQRYYNAYAEGGGPISYLDLNTAQEMAKRIKSEIASVGKHDSLPHKGWRLIRMVGDYVEVLNDSAENSMRFSAYVQARRRGMSEAQAISLAKNLTTNFERKGDMGAALNAWYIFANAGIQGTARIVQSTAHPAVRSILMGVMVNGAMIALANSLLSEVDDDGEKHYDKIPDYIKERNIILMIPGSKDGDRIQIPLPYGYNTVHHAGTLVSDVLTGSRGPGAAMSSMFSTFLNSFNPVGGDATLAQQIAPTVVDPIVQLEMNQSWHGGPIMPEKERWGVSIPDSQRYFNSVNPTARDVAQWINKVTGGSEHRSGWIDVSPESLEHWMEFVGGGAGRTAERVGELADKLYRGEPVTDNDVVLFRRFKGSTDDKFTVRKFYDNLEEIETVKREVKGALEAGDAKTLDRIYEDSGDTLALDDYMKDVREYVADLRTQIAEQDDVKERVRLEDEMHRAISEANRTFKTSRAD